MAHYGFSHLDSINASIRMLYRKLGNSRIMSFNRDLNNPAFQISSSQNQSNQVESFARAIAEHYRMSIGRVVASFKDIPNKAAHVDLSASSDFVVEVNTQAVQHSDDLLAVLAHEVTHTYLHRTGLHFSETMENEILTDTAATYLGLGNLILNAYCEQKKRIDRNTTEFGTKWFGYLTPVEFGYILAKRAKKFNCNPVPHLKRDASYAFYAGLAVLQTEYRFPPFNGATRPARLRYLWNRRRAGNKSIADRPSDPLLSYYDQGYAFEMHDQLSVIFKCPSCSQRLRIPAFRRLISVRCPKCECTYECAT
ncbi:conserved hypothetical protein [Syntrophobacter sp. SbD2]|nr:conserved hypothetical protein [Syntrophobacter sp. SbD2]